MPLNLPPSFHAPPLFSSSPASYFAISHNRRTPHCRLAMHLGESAYPPLVGIKLECVMIHLAAIPFFPAAAFFSSPISRVPAGFPRSLYACCLATARVDLWVSSRRDRARLSTVFTRLFSTSCLQTCALAPPYRHQPRQQVLQSKPPTPQQKKAASSAA